MHMDFSILKTTPWFVKTSRLPAHVSFSNRLLHIGRIYLVGNDVVIRNDDIVPSKPSHEAAVEKLAALTHHKGKWGFENGE